MPEFDHEGAYKEYLEEMENSQLCKDFAKSLWFAMWQYKYLLNAAADLIEENHLNPADGVLVVDALIKLLGAA